MNSNLESYGFEHSWEQLQTGSVFRLRCSDVLTLHVCMAEIRESRSENFVRDACIQASSSTYLSSSGMELLFLLPRLNWKTEQSLSVWMVDSLIVLLFMLHFLCKTGLVSTNAIY